MSGKFSQRNYKRSVTIWSKASLLNFEDRHVQELLRETWTKLETLTLNPDSFFLFQVGDYVESNLKKRFGLMLKIEVRTFAL